MRLDSTPYTPKTPEDLHAFIAKMVEHSEEHYFDTSLVLAAILDKMEDAAEIVFEIWEEDAASDPGWYNGQGTLPDEPRPPLWYTKVEE